MRYQLEVITLPVSDVDRAKDFYSNALGFNVDVDYAPTTEFRVVQLTPPGSACSIQIGIGLTDASPGTARETYLLVDDLESACAELDLSEVDYRGPEHKHPYATWSGGYAEGLDPERRNYASFIRFSDPDGNAWVIQERRA